MPARCPELPSQDALAPLGVRVGRVLVSGGRADLLSVCGRVLGTTVLGVLVLDCYRGRYLE